ncbi:MAG: hypothetical protein ABSC72_09270 [Methylovirgula sp.]|jgi:hypothetical protein
MTRNTLMQATSLVVAGAFALALAGTAAAAPLSVAAVNGRTTAAQQANVEPIFYHHYRHYRYYRSYGYNPGPLGLVGGAIAGAAGYGSYGYGPSYGYGYGPGYYGGS